ncbi:hypothetical protein YC2023_058523 [Brassica napus]
MEYSCHLIDVRVARNNEYMIVPPKEEVVRVIMRLMEGEEGNEIRNQMKELKERAVRVLREDGLSTKALTEVSLKWKSHLPEVEQDTTHKKKDEKLGIMYYYTTSR